MKKITLLASFMTFLLTTTFMLSVTTVEAQQKTKTTNPAVIANFVYCASDAADCETGNRVRQDKIDAYVDGVDGVSTVFNVVSGSYDLTINLINSQRSAWLDFRQVHKFYNNNNELVVPSWYGTPQLVKPHFNVLKAYKAKGFCGYEDVELTKPVFPCTMRTAMNSGGWKVSGDKADYSLQWNPDSVHKAVVNEQGPTSYVNVKYDKVDGNEIFTVTPIPNSDSNNVISGLAKTLSRTTSNAGQYVMPFSLVVKCKTAICK